MKASLRKGHLGGDQEAGKEEVFQAVGGMDKSLRESETASSGSSEELQSLVCVVLSEDSEASVFKGPSSGIS